MKEEVRREKEEDVRNEAGREKKIELAHTKIFHIECGRVGGSTYFPAANTEQERHEVALLLLLKFLDILEGTHLGCAKIFPWSVFKSLFLFSIFLFRDVPGNWVQLEE